MKVVLAPDSFKESMSAAQAAAAMARGVRAVWPDAECVEVPMADGGEGTVEALVAGLGGEIVVAEVTGPLGVPVRASYGWIEADGLAVMEVAAAVGIGLVPPAERDIARASSHGVGQLILDALDHGARRFIIGIGGTVTNDAGAGMLQALGVGLSDAGGRPVERGPLGLEALLTSDFTGLDPRLASAELVIASDVTNPLLGERGASAVFGPQKGATPDQVPRLDAALARLADHLDAHAGADIRHAPGAGAAGGLGAAFLSIGAGMRQGVEVVTQAARLEAALQGADLCFTGEGSVDAQTAHGKTPLGVAQVAGRQGVPVVLLAGRIGPGADELLSLGVAAILPINQALTSVEEALADGPHSLEVATASAVRLLDVGTRLAGSN